MTRRHPWLRFGLSCCYMLLLLLNYSLAEIYSNLWAVHIKGGERKARSIAEKHGFSFVEKILKDHYTFRHHQVSKRASTASHHHHSWLEQEEEVLWLEQQIIKSRVKRDLSHFNDVKWQSQWYLNQREHRQILGMNVESAWAKGYTGKGVVVTILDDGIEIDHPDLKDNYDKAASKDVNGGDSDPSPRYDYTDENRHGTRCAGEVAASANNSFCGVGVAFEANIGGIRMLDGDVTDSVEALSLGYNRDHIDVYSASWGPDDDGKTVDGPASLARKAFRDGVIHGRNGKGSIFVWASGNGGRDMDSCNCDGYTNSIYTLSISSATENGNVPWYSEACSSTLATTYSSGDVNERQIVTTDLRRRCTESHTGTSASAPLAAGLVALTLQANPKLTWRDMQHIVVMSANPKNLRTDDWVVNGVGRRVSHHFGYGMMNAGKMVDLARNWTTVPPQRVCRVVASQPMSIPSQETISIKLSTNGCEGSTDEVVFLEHVQAQISITSAWRGDLKIWLTSPMGTKATLLAARVNDNSKMGFSEWAFMSTHTWGEYSQGEWILEIFNGYRASPSTLKNVQLVFHGTKDHPLNPQRQAKAELECKEGQGCANNCDRGWFAVGDKCNPCHSSCVACKSAKNTSCTECYHGSVLKNGACVPAGDIYKVALRATQNDNDGLDGNTLWWLMVGGTVAMCMLVTFLLILAMYYAYTQGYLCDHNASSNPPESSTSTETKETSPHLVTSQHSSQQELMSSDEDESPERVRFIGQGQHIAQGHHLVQGHHIV